MTQRQLPSLDDVVAAAERIEGHAHRTPVLRSRSLDQLAGCELHFKCENFQRAGAFKFRGACNAVFALSPQQAALGVVTQSSGNHGAAIALACQLRDIPATVVVPEGASRVKLEAIRRYGAKVVPCAPTQAARDEATARIVAAHSATLVHPFDDARVIAGQGTAALEFLDEVPGLDILVAPVSGGGLLSGSLLAVRGHNSPVRVVGAEPTGAADAYASLRSDSRVAGHEVDTVCDGLRADLGELAFALLRDQVEIMLASDDESIAAMRLIWERMKIIVEPSSAVALAIILRHREHFAGQRVGVILSGGNVDLDALPWLTRPG